MERLSVPATRARVIAIAAVMFAAIFAARLTLGDAANGLTTLYVLPIVIAGVALGRNAGLAAGFVALVLFTVWAAIAESDAGFLSHASRAVAYLAVGGITGYMADRTRAAAAQAEETAKHFRLSRDMLCTSDFDGTMLSANESWERTLGWSAQELTSRKFIEFVHPDDREVSKREFRLAATAERTTSFVNRCRHRDGHWLWIEWTSQADPNRHIIYAAARDVTPRIEAEQAQRDAEERFQRAFADSAAGIAIVGLEGNVLQAANPSLGRILGRSPDDLVGKATIGELADPDDVPALEKGMARLESGDTPLYRAEVRIVRPDGRRVWVDLTASIVRDEAGTPLYRLSQLVDIDARRHAEEQLRYLADHDPLSGVYNRRRFEQDLERELGYAAMKRARGALLVLDVDNFKEINDTLGHAAGDNVIARIGTTLSDRLRSGDVIGRLGGDEFAVLLRRVGPDEAHEVARSIQDLAIERLADVAGDEIDQVTLSVGLATFGHDDTADTVPSMDELFRLADAAMYDAKRAGGNRVSVG